VIERDSRGCGGTLIKEGCYQLFFPDLCSFNGVVPIFILMRLFLVKGGRCVTFGQAILGQFFFYNIQVDVPERDIDPYTPYTLGARAHYVAHNTTHARVLQG